jgi:hypothetical protein
MDLNTTYGPAQADSDVANQHDAPSGEISFTTGESPLGIMLVARSANGVCAILIGSESAELTADLAARFPENTLVRNDRKLDGDLKKTRPFHRDTGPRTRSRTRHLRYAVPAAGVGCPLRNPGRPHRDLRRARAPHR